MGLLDLLGIQRIFHEGLELVTRKAIDFRGSVHVEDDAASGRTLVTVESGGTAGTVANDSSVSGATVRDALESLAGLIGSAGAVSTVFGRVGAVVATAGDYAASKIGNDSSVSGATVKAALEALAAALPTAGAVSSVYGRTGAIVAAAGDYVASKVSNDSSVSGSTVKAALESLAASIAAGGGAVSSVYGRTGAVVATLGDYVASKVSNDSSVSGSTVKAALESLAASIAGIVSGGGGWTTFLDVNLTTDSAFTFVDGANTWHGATWTGENIASGADSVAVVPGTGLVIDCNATSTDLYVNANSAPKLLLPMSQIPGYAIGCTDVRLSVQFSIAGADGNYELAKIGFIAYPYVSGGRSYWAIRRGFDGGSKSGIEAAIGGSSYLDLTFAYATNVFQMCMSGYDSIMLHGKTSTQPASDANSLEFTPSTMACLAEWNFSQAGTGAFRKPSTVYLTTPANLCVMLAACTVNTSNSLVLTIQRLRIEYKNK